MQKFTAILVLCLGMTLTIPLEGKDNQKRLGIGVRISNSDHLSYKPELLNMLTYELTIIPYSNISLRPLIGYRKYTDLIRRVDIDNGFVQQDVEWKIRAYGLDVSWNKPVRFFDVEIGAAFRKDEIDSIAVITQSFNGRVESGVDRYDNYDYESYLIKVGLAKGFWEQVRIEAEVGYRFSYGIHDNRALGELEEQSQGFHFGVSIAYMLL